MMRILVVFTSMRAWDQWRALDVALNPHSPLKLNGSAMSFRDPEQGNCIDAVIIADSLDITRVRGTRYDFVIFHEDHGGMSYDAHERLRQLVRATVLR